MILAILSCLGYLLVFKDKKIAAYIIFIIQNIYAYTLLEQSYMFINVVFCIIFLIKTNKQKNEKL